jgi:membrane fusion protein (multidrug efflux system)
MCKRTLFFIIFCCVSLTPPLALAKQNDNKTIITTTKVNPKQLVIYQNAVGNLSSLQAPTIGAENNGRVIAVNCDVGQYVTKGTVLAKLDNQLEILQLQAQQAELKRLYALQANQKLTVNRYQQLVAQKSQSQSMLDDAKAQLQSLQAQIEQTNKNIAQAQFRLDKTTITAPVSGYVQERYISVGDYLAVGSPVVKLVQTENLRATFALPEVMHKSLHIGQKVLISSPTAPNKLVTSTIKQIKPGASVDGKIELAHKNHALLIPEISVVSRPTGYVAYVIQHNKAIEQPINIGYSKNGEIEVLSGLKPNMIIAKDGAGFLDNGSAIRLQG